MTQFATADFEAISRLDADLKRAARTLGPLEARFLTDFYYQIQKDRIVSGHQVRKAKEGGEPNQVLEWFLKNLHILESNIKRALDQFTDEWLVGRWMKSIFGIGPVLSAGFLSYLDVRKCKTAGHYWRFAGLDESRWLSAKESAAIVEGILGTSKTVTEAHIMQASAKILRHPEYVHKTARFLTKKDNPKITKDLLSKVLSVRPWNARLKVLCFKLSDCFVKFSGDDQDYYGHLYLERRAYEANLNDNFDYRSQAEESLRKFNFGKDTEARKWYEQGKLPPGRLHLRAMRWTAKMFLSHLHHVMYTDFFGEPPPLPYAFTKAQGDHRHYRAPPNFPFDGGGRSLKEFYPPNHQR
jgi:hypothetical protein